MRESETIEYKKSLAELSEALISVAAIVNKHGDGELWFGVRWLEWADSYQWRKRIWLFWQYL